MDSNKILSISVAAYNLEKMIEQNLESFVNTKVREQIEVIVTDDESKDNTVQIVEKYQSQYPNIIKLVKQKNAGPGSTVNSGIKHATGKYFKMVDGDDWVESNNLEEFINILTNSDEDMILTNYEVFDNVEQKIISIEKVDIKPNVSYKFEDICSELSLDMHNVAIKTKILKENNIVLDNGFYTDVEYLLLPIPYVNTVKYIDINIYVYRVAQATQSVSIPSMQKNIKMHDIVLYRLINFYNDNKNKLNANKLKYLLNRIVRMADTQLGTLLTFEQNKDNKNKIKEFNKKLKESSMEIYKKYRKSKKAQIVIYSNYSLCKLASKMYIKKLSTSEGF